MAGDSNQDSPIIAVFSFQIRLGLEPGLKVFYSGVFPSFLIRLIIDKRIVNPKRILSSSYT